MGEGSADRPVDALVPVRHRALTCAVGLVLGAASLAACSPGAPTQPATSSDPAASGRAVDTTPAPTAPGTARTAPPSTPGAEPPSQVLLPDLGPGWEPGPPTPTGVSWLHRSPGSATPDCSVRTRVEPGPVEDLEALAERDAWVVRARGGTVRSRAVTTDADGQHYRAVTTGVEGAAPFHAWGHQLMTRAGTLVTVVGVSHDVAEPTCRVEKIVEATRLLPDPPA